MSGDMKVVAEIVYEAWDEIDQDTFQKSWQQIITVISPTLTSRGSGICQSTQPHS